MSVLEKIAYYQGRRDEVPNQELARELAESMNKKGIEEIASHLFDKDKAIQSDCLKVIYETGFINPALIEDALPDLLKLLASGNNRLVWGAMIALSTLADRKADELMERLDEIQRAMREGSVITVDNGIKILSVLAAKNDEYHRKVFPFLLKHLQNCRPKEVPQHAEQIVKAVSEKDKAEFITVLKDRETLMTEPQRKRIKRILKILENR